MKKTVPPEVIVELTRLGFMEDPNVYKGTVVKHETYSTEDLVNLVVSRGCEISHSTLSASVNLIVEAALEKLLQGNIINAFNVTFTLEVKGSFQKNDDKWEWDKHSLYVNVKPTKKMKEQLKHAKIKIRGMSNVGTCINTVTDVLSGKMNETLTPGGALRIAGKKVKIAGDNPENGVKLIRKDDGRIIPIPANRIVENRPSLVVLILPEDVPTGVYQLQLTTQYSASDYLLNSPRSYTHEVDLLV